MEDSFTKPVEEVVNYFKTDENTGLTDEQVQRYQEKYGPNELPVFSTKCTYVDCGCCTVTNISN